jgi:hypothetical protein
MTKVVPYLEVEGPYGPGRGKAPRRVPLQVGRLTIGRHEHDSGEAPPDLILDWAKPLVSRQHCVVERDRQQNRWWVADTSVQGTYVQRGKGPYEAVQGRMQLFDGDAILIKGLETSGGHPQFWRLVFRDPKQTHPPKTHGPCVRLEYDMHQRKLFRIADGRTQEIRLGAVERSLIEYMATRNQASQSSAVTCTRDELILALWNRPPNAKLNGLLSNHVFHVRKKVELSLHEPDLLVTIPGAGYGLRCTVRS